MFKIIHFSTLSSTNIYLKENYHQLEDNTVVVAEHQTAGRGRLGRSWYDGDDLLFSILLKREIENPSSLSLVVSSSLYKVLSKRFNNVTIKWPNDILVNSKKVVGILLEAVTSTKLECLIIGIGINMNTKTFPEEISRKATSLAIESPIKVTKEELLNDFLQQFENDYENFINGTSDYIDIHRTHSEIINKKVTSGDIVGIVKDILPNGNILIETTDGLIEKNSDEISLHNSY